MDLQPGGGVASLLCEAWVHHCARNVRFVGFTPKIDSRCFTAQKDSHAHILEYGASRIIPLEQGQTIKGELRHAVKIALIDFDSEVVKSVRDYIVSDPDINNNKSKLVQGWGWDHTVWPEGRWPNAVRYVTSASTSPLLMERKKDDLDTDPVIHGRPVILQSKDGHAIWVSRATLNDNGPYPEHVEGGVIETDSDGNPNGK